MASLLSIPGLAEAQAATVTSNLGVQITITNGCIISSITNINFGSYSVLSAAVPQTGTINVQCTPTLPYTIGLGAGAGSGASASATNGRIMTGGANTIAYGLYKDTNHTTTWTDIGGGGTAAGTGSGAVQPYTVYGLVPAVSPSPPAGTYTDTVLVTVSY